MPLVRFRFTVLAPGLPKPRRTVVAAHAFR